MIELRNSPRAAPDMPNPADWRDRAACAGVTDDTFFPTTSKDPAAAAKLICRRCSVSAECLLYATAARLDGVFGGTTTAEREQLKRRAVVA